MATAHVCLDELDNSNAKTTEMIPRIVKIITRTYHNIAISKNKIGRSGGISSGEADPKLQTQHVDTSKANPTRIGNIAHKAKQPTTEDAMMIKGSSERK